jgi:hypothetical protein
MGMLLVSRSCTNYQNGSVSNQLTYVGRGDNVLGVTVCIVKPLPVTGGCALLCTLHI